MSSVLALSLFVGIIAGCETKEPTPTPTPDPPSKPTTISVTGVSLSKTILTLVEGTSETLTATMSPENASDKSVSWKSSATDVATVDDSGKVTAVKAGFATVTVTTKDGSKTATCSVTVTEAPKIVISGNTAKVPVQGGTAEFPIQYNTSYTIEIEQSAKDWLHFVQTRAMESGTLVFSIDANPGEARTGKATVKDNEGKLTPITLTFEQDPYIAVTSVQVTPESAELEVGETLTLTAKVLPDDATDKTVTWASDNETVATVTVEGVVTATAEGTATITVTNGAITATCVVTVKPSSYEIERAALVALYNATDGDNWRNNDNWCSDKPLNEWYGIYTEDDASDGRVTIVFLANNGLSGQIPPEIFTLPKLASLCLHYNNLTGSIPVEIGNAKTLLTLRLQHNNLTGTIPESLYQLQDIREIQLWSNRLSGELSERFWDLPDLEYLAVDDNLITGELTAAVKKAKKLTWLGLGSNKLKGTIPPEIAELTNLNYFSIENHAVGNGSFTEAANDFSGTIPDNLDNLQNLEFFLAENNNLEGTIPICFAKMPKLTSLELYGNRLSGELAEELVECDNWDIWAPDANIMPQQEGYTLSFSHYESTDYSRDGQVIKLQTHEKGNGINIVITGDCFTDQDIAAGEFETIARQTMEDFFGIEPFTTFRNLFDVYAVVAVSKTRYSGYGTALGAQFGEGAYVYCDEEIVKEYSRKAVSDLDETLTIVIVNKNKNSGTAFMPNPTLDTDYGSGFSYACFGLQAQSTARRLLINHEANGHGFTKLQDEYFISGGSAYPEDNKQYIRDIYFSKGYYANVDFESAPEKVKWSKFLFDDRYKYDGLGVFEGGMSFPSGVWRPSENSIMGQESEFNGGDRFNAPSRAAAYIRIHKLAYGSSWEFDYEEFVKYDAINRKTSVDNQ